VSDERDNIARYLMGEFLGVTWGRAYAAADAVIGLRREAERPKAECTGLAAVWCPVHGDCACDKPPGVVSTHDNPRCPLHGEGSEHAEVEPKPAPPLEALETVKAFAEPFMRQFYRDDWSYVREALSELESFVKAVSQ
jgi:hypothetical protein